MSVDWQAICDKHRIKKHLGQASAGGTFNSFGNGSNDSQGRQDSADFVGEHIECGLRIAMADSEQDPEDYESDKRDD